MLKTYLIDIGIWCEPLYVGNSILSAAKTIAKHCKKNKSDIISAYSPSHCNYTGNTRDDGLTIQERKFFLYLERLSKNTSNRLQILKEYKSEKERYFEGTCLDDN